LGQIEEDLKMKEIKAFVRSSEVPGIIRELIATGAHRVHISQVHVVGAGVDDVDYRVSLSEGASYSELTKLEALARAENVAGLVEVLRGRAGTGKHGDGIIVVTDVDRIISVRTGDEGEAALV
jgi:nitrogen regulatory protein P-II 1